MPRKNTTNTNKKTGKEKHKTKVGERGKKKPKPSETSPGPVATTEGEFLEALRKEFFACLAEQGFQLQPCENDKAHLAN